MAGRRSTRPRPRSRNDTAGNLTEPVANNAPEQVMTMAEGMAFLSARRAA